MAAGNFDRNATWGISANVSSKLPGLLVGLGNPNSVHRQGQRARALIEDAREQLAVLLGLTRNERIIFTSGATESNNTVLLSGIPLLPGGQDTTEGATVVSTEIEHPSVLRVIERLQRSGVRTALVSPLPELSSLPERIAAVCGADTRIVSVMAANNETGHLLPVAEIAAAVRRVAPRALIHCDAVQLLGRQVFSFRDLGADVISLSGHKIGALPGVGALVVAPRVHIDPLLFGGPQEVHQRAGTENVPGIISFGLAAQEAAQSLTRRIDAMRAARDRFEHMLLERLPLIDIQGSAVARLPNTSSVTIVGVRSDDLVVALDQLGICISSGAACASGKPEPSHVLRALRLNDERARSTIRVSFGEDHEPSEIDRLADAVVSQAGMMRARAAAQLASAQGLTGGADRAP